MILFLDTEFTALRQDAELISLALVSEGEDWFYAEFTDYNAGDLSSWHQEHVLPYLFLTHDRQPPNWIKGKGVTHLGKRAAIAPAVRDWLGQFGAIEIWADAPSYDWVLFCELLGGSLNLPEHLFYLPFDLVTLLKIKGMDPDTKRENLVPEWVAPSAGAKHNALYDAFLLKAVYQKIGIEK